MQNFLNFLPSVKSKITNELLRKWNITLTALYAIQGGALLLLSTSHFIQLNSLFTTTDSLQTKLTGEIVLAPAVHQLITINLVGLVAAFIFVSAILHLLAATIYRPKYEAWLKRGSNPLRWIEYSLSGGIMFVVIGLLVGIYDIASLLMLFIFSIILGLMGIIIETKLLQTKKKQTFHGLDKYLLLITAVIPWLIIGLYVIGSNVFGSGLPNYIYVVYVSTLLLFIAIGVNFLKAQTKKGKWVSYTYGECLHMGLSFIVQSLLAWQIFIDVLHP